MTAWSRTSAASCARAARYIAWFTDPAGNILSVLQER